MYNHILIPTDGSDVAQNAIDHAIDLATRHDATLHALYVVDLDAVDLSLGTEQVQRIKEGQFDEMTELQQRATAAIQAVTDRAGDDLEVVESIQAGRPHRRIRDYVESEEIDAVVMGSAGRSGVRRALLGSVAERTIRNVTVPVLIVDAREE
ncbi:universal stress protein [Natrarchaeobaculum sulfurireducens]|uniref:Nucleotide-binding protein, UspA family n=1 Tax=Natrarchaeobaculum sulfurireducens TaxID=2044521 RepID=A0A346PR33_9EURY|nr:universal stress protein [Natrarchaeobaculum sulfurireducens]AXR78033.1 Nucleotide-binding protein, UspA family [Natrarchaeobaculum sulfurireducens]AXR81978.1 Universal stress protein [Natrarchaeobaculum sulfurireducens]